MSFEQRNLKVFLSSSMAEFFDHRATVKKELDKLGIPNFVFEREGASGDSPEKIFRTAVRGASVYIGIFGRACGKYTREEYDMARAQGISCHLYVQSILDEDRSDDLKEFLLSLQGVSGVPTSYTFQSADDLVSRIMHDVVAWMDQKVGWRDSDRDQIDSRDNLPILCDRDPQEVHFRDQIVSYFDVRSTRPLLLILLGPEQEKHGLYLDRLEFWSWNEYLTNIRGEKKVLRILKNPCALSTPRHIQSEILGLLQGSEEGNDKNIVAFITQARIKALLIIIRLKASECDGNPQRPLQLIADYLAAFPDTKESVLVSVMVSLEEDSKQSLLNRWFGMAGSNKSAGLFEKSSLDLEKRYWDGSKLLVKVLPRLASPNKADVDRWLDHKLLKKLLKRSALRVGEKEMAALFKGRDSLPMGELYPKLVNLLKDLEDKKPVG